MKRMVQRTQTTERGERAWLDVGRPFVRAVLRVAAGVRRSRDCGEHGRSRSRLWAILHGCSQTIYSSHRLFCNFCQFMHSLMAHALRCLARMGVPIRGICEFYRRSR
eukprot:1177261-Prorocentrum_minimum.AAC.2